MFYRLPRNRNSVFFVKTLHSSEDISNETHGHMPSPISLLLHYFHTLDNHSPQVQAERVAQKSFSFGLSLASVFFAPFRNLDICDTRLALQTRNGGIFFPHLSFSSTPVGEAILSLSHKAASHPHPYMEKTEYAEQTDEFVMHYPLCYQQYIQISTCKSHVT